MLDYEAAYVAGLIDGEGSLQILPVKQHRQNGESYIAHHVRLHIGITDKTLIDWVHKITGNGHIEYRSNDKHPNWKPCYILVWSSIPAVALLTRVMPFLRLKKRHAEIAIEWRDIVKDGRSFVGGRGRHDRTFPPAIIRRRNKLLAEMKLLNRKGR